jgi:PAS domain S-box-containing protein
MDSERTRNALKTADKSPDTRPAKLHTEEQRVPEKAPQMEAFLEAFDGFIYLCSQDYRIEYMNAKLINRTGYDATGEQCFKALHDRKTICPWCKNDQVFKGETIRLEMQSPKDNCWFHIVNIPIHHPDGSKSKQAMFTDITERKNAEEALRKNEARLVQIVNGNPIPTFVIDDNHIVTHWNKACENLTGLPADRVIGTNRQWAPFYAQERPIIADLLVNKAAESEIVSYYLDKFKHSKNIAGAYEAENFFSHFGESGKWLFFTAAPLKDIEGRIIGAVETLQDITDQKHAMQAVEKASKEWERTFNAINDIVILQDTSMKIVKINKTGCDTLNLPFRNIIGQHCYELFHGSNEPCPDCPLLVTQETLKPYINEITHEKLGKTFLVSTAPVLDDQGTLTHITHVAKDITEKNKIKEQLFLNEKLATIAGLAAGVAHEINTPLSAILQAQQIIDMRLDPYKPRNQERAAECGVDLTKVGTYFKNNDIDFFMKGIRDSAITAGKIIKNLLEFSRPHKSEIRNASLSKLLDTTMELAMADYDLKKRYDIINVEIVKEYDSDLTEVPCVAMEIEQVIFNLVKNAVHAMADNNIENPCITIRTVKTEEIVRIEVEDNGPGIDEETQLHIFDPFFTTKDVGAGTGLGLYVSHALVVDNHMGNIWVESKPNKGGKFIVELPLRSAPGNLNKPLSGKSATNNVL